MRAGMSAAVYTACTPGSARAALGIDAADAGVRVRAAHERRVQRAGQVHVIDELPAPGEQHRVFKPRDARAEMFRTHAGSIRRGAGY